MQAGSPIDNNAMGQNEMTAMNLQGAFGNTDFQPMQQAPGVIANDFGQLNYVSLDSLMYWQKLSAPPESSAIQTGSMGGSINIQGTMTAQDNIGNTRVMIGYKPGAF